ncbi:hypothetical protein DPQ22_00405 [Candidatus Tokpelaia sp.]|nr:hypothetical protein DPQ22_00405 [Candidatus Tokpelaia sp.]
MNGASVACRGKIILRQGSFVLKRAPDFFGIDSGGGGAFCTAYARPCGLHACARPCGLHACARPCGLHACARPCGF